MALNDEYQTNLLKLIAAELYYHLGLTAAREMYGKSYFSLGMGEKAVVDQAVMGAVGGNYQALTPEFLKGQPAGQPALVSDVSGYLHSLNRAVGCFGAPAVNHFRRGNCYMLGAEFGHASKGRAYR